MSDWAVTFTAKAAKQTKKLPKREREAIASLLADLRQEGVVLPNWPNYSKLGGNRYQCHLSYKWVACWILEDKKIKLIEIYYVGSRENAPY